MRIYDYVDAINSGKKVTITKQSAYQNKVYEYVFGYVLTHTAYTKDMIDTLLIINKRLMDNLDKYNIANIEIIKAKDCINKLEHNRRSISQLLSALQYFNKDIVREYISTHIIRLADIIQDEYDTYSTKDKEYDDIIKTNESIKEDMRDDSCAIMSMLLKDIGYPSHKAFRLHCKNIYNITTFSIQILLDKLYGMYICNTNQHINDAAYDKNAVSNFRLVLTANSYMILDGSTYYYYCRDDIKSPYTEYKICAFSLMYEVIKDGSNDYISDKDVMAMYRRLIEDIKAAIYNGNNW